MYDSLFVDDGQECNSEILDAPVYEGSKETVRQAVARYVRTFVDKSLSKAALTQILRDTHELLPAPCQLPKSYEAVFRLISHEFVSYQKYHVCANECLIFTKGQSAAMSCYVCGSERYKLPDALGRRYPKKAFTYISIESSLKNMFGHANIAQVIQEAGGCSSLTMVTDLHETELWNSSWMTAADDHINIVLGLNADGVNPYHGSGIQYSMWPILVSVLNLPKRVRTKADAIILVGLIPSRDVRLNQGVEPDIHLYLELVVDELICLSSIQLYSAYKAAPIKVKVKLLLYMLDFQGYAKFFRMSGSAAYFSCNICNIKATRDDGKMSLIGHGEHQHFSQRDYKSEVGCFDSKKFTSYKIHSMKTS